MEPRPVIDSTQTLTCNPDPSATECTSDQLMMNSILIFRRHNNILYAGICLGSNVHSLFSLDVIYK